MSRSEKGRPHNPIHDHCWVSVASILGSFPESVFGGIACIVLEAMLIVFALQFGTHFEPKCSTPAKHVIFEK